MTELEKENKNLKDALNLAARWGIDSGCYSGDVAYFLRKWVDEGFNGPPLYHPDSQSEYAGILPTRQDMLSAIEKLYAAFKPAPPKVRNWYLTDTAAKEAWEQIVHILNQHHLAKIRKDEPK